MTGVNATSDFTTLDAGKYCVYGVGYSMSVNINTWISKTLSQILIDGDCFFVSDNCKMVEIKSSCTISGLVAGSQGPCQASSNYYTQNLTVTYDKAPSTGKLQINGQDFDILTSPQTITLVNLNSDGLPVDINAFFTASPNCKLTKLSLFTAPGLLSCNC
ncbi:MAG: hypothetical protein IPO92_17905 [Saprospiraceae bacterium]|nr:hypothetical protein [Saprospiraceae bacterium]